mgnify:CR=1 FL=1
MTKRETTPKMTTAQETTNPQDEAQKIWDQLEAEESGHAQPATNEPADPPADQTPASAAADPAPAEPPADATPGSDAAAPDGSQALMDKIAGLESMLGQVTQRLRNAEGHIGGLGSQLKQQQQLAAQVTARGGDAPSAGEIRAAQSSAKAMESLKRDYPEFAEAMEAALTEQMQALRASMPQQAQQAVVTPDDMQLMRSQMEVEIRHPGWQDRVQTPDFQGWLQRQQPEVQMLAASASPRDAIRLLDLHSEALKTVTSQRTQRLSAAAAIPSGRSGSQTRTKAVEDMTPQEYWAYLDQLDKQKA